MRGADDNPRVAVRRGRHATALIIPEAYSGAFARGEPATVEVVLDSSRLASLMAGNQLLGLLRG